MSYIRPDQREAFERHVLTELAREGHAVLSCPVIRAFNFRRPDSGFYSVLLLFTATGHAVILGDLKFGDLHGLVGTCPFGLFSAKDVEEDYLASKFLTPGRRLSGPKGRERWDNEAGWLAALQQAFVRKLAELPEASHA